MANESAADAMASDCINVVLMSGRAAQVPVIMDRPLKRVKLEAQSARCRLAWGSYATPKGVSWMIARQPAQPV